MTHKAGGQVWVGKEGRAWRWGQKQWRVRAPPRPSLGHWVQWCKGHGPWSHCPPGPGRSAAHDQPAPWQPLPLPSAPEVQTPRPPGHAHGTPRPALPWSPPAAIPVGGRDGGGSGPVRGRAEDGAGETSRVTWVSCSWDSALLSSLPSLMALDSASLSAVDTLSSSAWEEEVIQHGGSCWSSIPNPLCTHGWDASNVARSYSAV